MAVPSDLLARELADEFNRRARPAAILEPGARGALVDEFRARLDASKNPDELAFENPA
jgi:hypothetical protein